MDDLLGKRFVVVAGKGGVGRTTVSLVIGKLAALRGKRVLVCLANAPPRYSDLLEETVLDAKIQEAVGGLHVVNLDPKVCEEEYGLMILHNRILHRLVFGSRIVRTFLDAVPGLAEWAMLGKATYHALKTSDGGPEYDMVVFDSPATGHGLDVLALPRAIVSAVPGGRMREEAELRVALMGDASQCEVVPVTIPEEIPVNETIELVAALGRLGLAVRRMVVNMMSSRADADELLGHIAGLAEEGVTRPSWLVPAAAAVRARQMEKDSLARLAKTVCVPQIELPALPGGWLHEGSILTLVRAFEAAFTPKQRA
ncbi:MAG: ArsA-related P-loop ATPase [Deltaproteobacteria bacterium]|nr:ArsA-related P-loop ATPase [Deltaproteobacteria bacterium]